MELIRCRIAGFGKLVDRALRFRPGLNVVFAPNEEGKTTLQHFLIALLYGPLRPAVTAQRRLEPWAERYRPWSGADYGGTLWCRLARGEELEIRRRFDPPWTEVRSETGEDVGHRYPQQRNGELLFAQELFGMPKELFESLAVVRENRAGELADTLPIRDRIANLATTGDEQVSLRRTLERLEAALDAIGSERAPTRPYRQTQERLAALGRERAGVENLRAERANWLLELERRTAAVVELEARRDLAARSLSAARRRDAAAVVALLQDLDGEIAAARAEHAGSPYVYFPADRLQELENLAGARASTEARRTQAADSLEGARACLRQAAAARQRLAHHAGVDPDLASRRTAERLVRHDAAARGRRDAAGALEEARGAALRLRERVEALPASLADGAVDWEARAEDATARERAASLACVALAADQLGIVEETAALARRRTVAAALAWGGGLAALMLAGAALLGQPVAPLPAGLAAGLAAVLAVSSALAAAARGRRLRGLAAQGEAVAARQAEERRALDGASAEIRSAAASAGTPTVEEFLVRARAAAALRRELAECERRVAELESAFDAALAAERAARADLDGELAALGIVPPPDPGQYGAEVDRLIAELKEFRGLDGAHRDARQAVEGQAAQLGGLDEEEARIAGRMRAILASGGVDSLGAFREGCRGRARAEEAARRLEALERERGRVAAGKTLDEWRQRVRMLAAAAEGTEAPPSAAAEEEERAAAAALAEAREERARLAERVRRAFENHRTIAAIAEDQAEAERRLAALEVDREALELARALLEQLGRERQEVLAPELNRAVEARFRRLSGGRWADVKITPGFEVLVRESSDGMLRGLDSLSRGARDQLYLALRFGVLELVTERFEPSPCLLDEPFAAYDRERLASAFAVVREEAGRRQVMLFTCREDVRQGALASGAWVVELGAAAGAPLAARAEAAEGEA